MTLDDPTAARLVAVLERLEQRLATPAQQLAGERRLATLQEAMDLLGCRRSMVFRLVRQKKIVRVLEGRHARFDVESIERHIAEQVESQRGGRPAGSKGKNPAELEAEKIARLKP